MVVNIGRFSNRQLLPLISNDSFMITILRNPVNHFESVYEYADISKLIGLWNKTHDPFNAFLQAPRNSTIEFVQNSRPVAIELNMLTNGKFKCIKLRNLLTIFLLAGVFVIVHV